MTCGYALVPLRDTDTSRDVEPSLSMWSPYSQNRLFRFSGPQAIELQKSHVDSLAKLVQLGQEAIRVWLAVVTVRQPLISMAIAR